MVFDVDLIKHIYLGYLEKIKKIQIALGKPLTLTEKILYAHLAKGEALKPYQRGIDYVNFAPDRVAMQDATAQMALLQLMNSGRDKVAVPSTVHCDHLIVAYKNAKDDLHSAEKSNKEVYSFLRDVSNKYGIGFWKPGAGIIHQVVLENYAFPGGMMIGTDSHTPNAGGLSMIAIGVGGADAVDVMAGLPWELKMPKIIGVKLIGKLSGWASPKDVILKLAGILTVKGGTNSIIEYFGEGTHTLSATGKATICNMGAEVGATTSIFPFDQKSVDYLNITDRKEIADLAQSLSSCFKADDEVMEKPTDYYDQVIEIDLNHLEPHVNGPFTPDLAYPISKFAQAVAENDYPENMEVGLIGSCTNSSYEDLSRAASVIKNAHSLGLKVKSQLIINPGSEQVKETSDRDGIIANFEQVGAVIMANACGPCIGQWRRAGADKEPRNSIVTSFNRNFAKRNDGNPHTYAFVCSPEIVAAFAIAGSLTFNPLKDSLINEKGESVKLAEPFGDELPKKGFTLKDAGYTAPVSDGSQVKVTVSPDSDRLQLLAPFPAWDGKDIIKQPLLIKVSGKCTTDHISMAGIWLKYRGHLDNIANNMLIGAVNAFNKKTNSVIDPETGNYLAVPALARKYKAEGLGSIIVAEENYGEGSSREHAAMEPRFLNVKAIIVKSFARIHETNLKKQGMLALTFIDKADYEKIAEQDKISILGLTEFAPGKNLIVVLTHKDGSEESFEVSHTYNEAQIEWFKAGSALNKLKSEYTLS
ncbi:aconitate hydratase [Zymomonas mobilis]|uniref:Aconitate hydratase A n=1 Tax=Zymomonas mobilis subsp. pomaceae (strain ATCC 29192 / DSM 22645 / JCM 10191 / CCUG 17912 / NBRC 13757 / NCIMB 11200 / NRRL B-4491 / Barker I) TaxID=579138 RepID=F8ES00_ZYMMT|nr:aconitate hydratase [Zymomonas mobilis]AEI37575.1 aconitate hydratase [Zymomonas mobilis subsp. pomaceae ATCC 29192]MDX5948943.1 aconitate hydratase [Zymomonas mobilis subsp. pomaceae]GEB88748.1 aconitate hydratase [Zymomonas mobilis subsp. pomaceae]